MKKKKELWLQNLSQSDVSLSDLGIKVQKGKTIEVFAFNPYLTELQVNNSMEDGSLSKRLSTGVLKVVSGPSKERPAVLDQINAVKDSDTVLVAKKNKSSVIVETRPVDLEQDDSFDFADYDVDMSEATKPTSAEHNSVVVKQKEDEVEKAQSESNLKPELQQSNISKQSAVFMQNLAEKQSDSFGKLADSKGGSPEKPFVVIDPPKSEKEQVKKAEKPAKTEVKASDESVTVDVEKKPKAKKKTKKKKSKKSFDTKAATKTENGAIVMELKEEKSSK